jgi:hypothetical protein
MTHDTARAGDRLAYLSPPAIPESRSDAVSDYDQRTSAEDLVLVLQSLSGSAPTLHHPMAPGEWMRYLAQAVVADRPLALPEGS